MTNARDLLAAFEATEPAAVEGMGNVIASLEAETTIGPVVGKLAAGWTGTFADLVVTAAQLADPTAEQALAFEIVLGRLLAQRAEDRFFAGAAAHRTDWPVRRAIGDAQWTLGEWRKARTGCAGCGRTGRRWAASTHVGIGPAFFLEHWCTDCAGDSVVLDRSGRPRALPKLDYAALHAAYGKVATVGSPGSGYTLKTPS